MSEKKPFQWAADPSANLQEPIEGLKKKGWQFGDVPTASNFNWLFNDIQKDLEKHSEKLNSLNQIRNDLAALNTKVSKINSAVTYILPAIVELISSVNTKRITQLYAAYPFRYSKDNSSIAPITDFATINEVDS